MIDHGHPIEVDLERILPILARQIYTTPFAFLRENVQNAVDAIRIQQYREKDSPGPAHEHEVAIEIIDNGVEIHDTGIGMTESEVKEFFWSIGRSGKHTDEAKNAGVVGTFGIGGMANFGICRELRVLTRAERSIKATRCQAKRESLSASRDCVFYSLVDEATPRGTTVSAILTEKIDSEAAINYLRPIVEYINIPIRVNGTVISGLPFPAVDRQSGRSVTAQEGAVSLQAYVRVPLNGQAECEVESLSWNGEPQANVRGLFKVGGGPVSGYQYGFKLAQVPVSTVFSLGGVLDCASLRPTAGREALTDGSQRLVQQTILALEHALAEAISDTPGAPDTYAAFFHYLRSRGRWDLAGKASVRLYGRHERIPLNAVQGASTACDVFFAQETTDKSIMEAYKSQNKYIVILSTDRYRREIEREFLTRRCGAKPLEDRVTCLRLFDDSQLNFEMLSLNLHLQRVLRTQYFIEGLIVKPGELSHGAMIWVPPQGSGAAAVVYVDPRHAHIERLLTHRDSLGFDALVDVFVRDSILPQLENAFPDLRKRDFESMLQRIQSTVEYFQIDPQDLRRLQFLAKVTNMTPEEVAAALGARRPGSATYTSVSRSEVAKVTDVLQASVDARSAQSLEEARIQVRAALLTSESEAKLLDATGISKELGISGYYLAMTSDAHVLYRRIFLESRPSADFSWGGHRIGFVFYTEGTSILYYDIALEFLVSFESKRSGSVTLDRDPIVCKNMIYLPLPPGFEAYLVPREQPVRLTVLHQIMGGRPSVD